MADLYRYVWRDAVIRSDLRTNDKIVALVFEWHASGGTEAVWVHGPRLCELTSLGKTAAQASLKRLRQAGWLVVTKPAAQHYSPRYALRIPSSSPDEHLSSSPDELLEDEAPAPRTADTQATNPAVRLAAPAVRHATQIPVPSPDFSSSSSKEVSPRPAAHDVDDEYEAARRVIAAADPDRAQVARDTVNSLHRDSGTRERVILTARQLRAAS